MVRDRAGTNSDRDPAWSRGLDKNPPTQQSTNLLPKDAEISCRSNRLIKAWSCAGKMAGVAGLEPVTSAVTGQRSNQLSYTPAKGSVKIRNVRPPVKFWFGFFWRC